jgi:hypothetical protein
MHCFCFHLGSYKVIIASVTLRPALFRFFQKFAISLKMAFAMNGYQNLALIFLLFCLLFVLMEGSNAQKIESVKDLNDEIIKGPNRKVGFLSQGNFESVHALLSNLTVPVIITDKYLLEKFVENGTLLAGLISGVPLDQNGFLTKFSSTLVSPRAAFTSRNQTSDHMTFALNAAIVRVLRKGKDRKFAERNAPFEYLAVHSCRATDSTIKSFPFPMANESNGILKMVLDGNREFLVGGIGPFNWAQDGDYTKSNPTGFWPEFLDAMLEEFQIAYGGDIRFKRIYYSSSNAAMDALVNNAVHFLEPYWTVDAFYLDSPRIQVLRTSCTTLGYDSTFFALEQPGEDPSHKTTIILSIVFGVLGLILIFVLGILIYRERRGKPVFAPFSEEADQNVKTTATKVEMN